MKRLRSAAITLILGSLFLFVLVGLELHFGFVANVFAERTPLTLSEPQAVPTAAAEIEDVWDEWVSVEMPNIENTYFIKRLDDTTRSLCAGIYNGIAAFNEEIILPEPISEQVLSEAMWLISYDCPELFQISGDYSYYVRENAPGMVISIRPTYVMTPEEYSSAMEEVRGVLSSWLMNASSLSDYEIEKLVYDKLINNCVYEKEGPHTGSVYGALVLGSARCEGYAKAVSMALRTAGMESMILTGEATTGEGEVEKHAWNVVKVDGQYCQIDATWDDPDEAHGGISSYAFFNLTDEEMYKSRSLDPIYLKWELPVCDSTAYSYHNVAIAYIKVGQDTGNAIYDLLDRSFHSEKNYLTGKFETDGQVEELSEGLESWVSKWYHDNGFKSGSYKWVVFPDSRVFMIFHLSYE